MILLAFTLYLLFGAPDDPGRVTVRFLPTQQACDLEARHWKHMLDPELRKTVRHKCVLE